MSLILLLIYWVGVPLILYRTTRWAWKLTTAPAWRASVIGVATVLSLYWVWLLFGAKLWVDHQVRELCAKDGGVRVYETVKLPPEKFNEWGQPKFSIPVTPYQNLKDTDDYFIELKITDLKGGYAKIERNHFILIRHYDNKRLGESVFYSRSGGDLSGPWHSSSFMCPKPGARADFISQIFIIETKE